MKFSELLKVSVCYPKKVFVGKNDEELLEKLRKNESIDYQAFHRELDYLKDLDVLDVKPEVKVNNDGQPSTETYIELSSYLRVMLLDNRGAE